MDQYMEYSDAREPNSNAEMPFIYAERKRLELEAAAKKEAEEKAKAKEAKASKKQMRTPTDRGGPVLSCPSFFSD